MKGTITIEALQGGYVIYTAGGDKVESQIVTSKNKAIRLVRDALDSFDTEVLTEEASAEE